MLAANEAVARELKHRSIPTIYRVHENPDPEKLAEFRELVLSYNFKVGDLTQRRELQRLLASRAATGRTRFQNRAAQKPQTGALFHRSRSATTASPSRTTRISRAHSPLCGSRCPSLPGRGDQKRLPKTEMGQLTSIAEHISITDAAAEAEIDAVPMKKLEFFERQLAERDPQVFRATIMDVRNYGLLIELPDVLLTGLVHVSSLADDFYVFEAARVGLLRARSRKRFAVGDELRVCVARVDRFKRQIDFAVADERKRATQPRLRR